jgi:hypothetical protein
MSSQNEITMLFAHFEKLLAFSFIFPLPKTKTEVFG